MTIEFTYNADTNCYCIKIYKGSEVINRYVGSDRKYAIEKFAEEMAFLEGLCCG
jgi:hypothetical protein